jgi:uncharacterized protein YkwD
MQRRVLLLWAVFAWAVLVPAPVLGASAEQSILDRVNKVRRAHHLPAVAGRGCLSRVARRHSRYLARIQRLQHESANGATADERIRGVLNVSFTGETLAYGSSAGAVVAAWMKSPPHRSLLLDRDFHVIGVGVKRRGAVLWTTADFGG